MLAKNQALKKKKNVSNVFEKTQRGAIIKKSHNAVKKSILGWICLLPKKAFSKKKDKTMKKTIIIKYTLKLKLSKERCLKNSVKLKLLNVSKKKNI